MNSFKKTLLICWFGVFATSMGLSQVAPILPLYIRSLGVSEYRDISFYSGLCFGITSLLMAFFAPLWGALTNRFGYKVMLLRASLAMAILTLLLAFASNVHQVLILRAITGIFSGFTSSAIIFIAVISPKSKVTYALATLSTASVSGNLIGPMFGGLFAELMGIRAVFIFIASLLFISFFTIYFFIKEEKIRARDKRVIEDSSHIREDILLILMLFFLTFIIQAGFNAVLPIMTLFVEQIYHSSSYIAFWTGLIVAASGISNLIFTPKLGKIADRIGPSKIITISLFSCGVLFYLQSLASNISILIILRLLLGVTLGGLVPCINALFKKCVSQKRLGLVFGFNQSAFALGNFIGAISGGYIAGRISIEAVFIIVCASFILSSIIFFIIERGNILSKKAI